MTANEQAAVYLREFKGERYVFGLGCAPKLGGLVADLGRRAAVVASGVGAAWAASLHETTRAALKAAGVTLAGPLIRGAAPNTPREDVFRIAEELRRQKPDAVVSVGGGSGIDAVKAAVVWIALGDKHAFDSYFGVGQVGLKLREENRALLPVAAVQLASSSSSHLTKYSNITNLQAGQKLLIVDDAIVPPRALFDYRSTLTMSKGFTMEGALDGVSHCLEVHAGIPSDKRGQAEPVCLLGIELIVQNLKQAVAHPDDESAREALGLGTDLGGYAIMIGGTNGAHLNSFSLVDLLPHGQACALMNPYYMVFFAPVIEDRLRPVGEIYRRAGYVRTPLDHLHGRALGEAVAEGMLALSRDIGFPTTLSEVKGFTEAHAQRCLSAAKQPQLESKLRNMPVPLSAATIDEYMGPILAAARNGDIRLIRNMGV